MGTPDFAVACLESVIKAGHDVAGVFTQPDKPKGRGYALAAPPVKLRAQEYGLTVYQPSTLRDGSALACLKELEPECIVVVAYGKILPKEIIELPKFGCINIHASLLPKYRGAAPIQWSIINGERETGVTAMYMDEGLDTGDIIMKKSCIIGENETAGELHDRLSALGAQMLPETLLALEAGTAVREKQDDSKSCYAAMLDKSLCKIDWSLPAEDVHNKVRGLSPWPTATAVIDGKSVKLHKTRLCEKSGAPGEIISLSPLTAACGSGSVIIDELQPQGKKRMDSRSFLNGHKLKLGERFE